MHNWLTWLSSMTLCLLVPIVSTHWWGSRSTTTANNRLKYVVSHCSCMVHSIAMINSVSQIVTKSTFISSLCSSECISSIIRIARFQTSLALYLLLMNMPTRTYLIDVLGKILLRSFCQAWSTTWVDVSSPSMWESIVLHALYARVTLCCLQYFVLFIVVHNLSLNNRATSLTNHCS